MAQGPEKRLREGGKGGFFQNRYKSMICEEDAYLRELVISHIEEICPSEGVGLEEKSGGKCGSIPSSFPGF
jgi:hypothetical protein